LKTFDQIPRFGGGHDHRSHRTDRDRVQSVLNPFDEDPVSAQIVSSNGRIALKIPIRSI
jgi:hypothetical protein